MTGDIWVKAARDIGVPSAVAASLLWGGFTLFRPMVESSIESNRLVGEQSVLMQIQMARQTTIMEQVAKTAMSTRVIVEADKAEGKATKLDHLETTIAGLGERIMQGQSKIRDDIADVKRQVSK